jgi:GTPase SAR1 family protein
MGACGSAEDLSPQELEARKNEEKRNKALNSDLENDRVKDKAINKLLLLGAGESGKSTLFKQVISIYGKGFNEAERKAFSSNIHFHILQSMQDLCTASHKYGPVAPQLADSCDDFENKQSKDAKIDEKMADAIAALWQDAGIQKTYANRSHFQLNDSAKYFFDKVHEVANVRFVPTMQDVYRVRVRTTGVIESDFEIEGNKFKMVDVGGQRNERKKWIHSFQDVTAVIFVAALSEYDQGLYEDQSVNRMTEALDLFEETCNSKWFFHTNMILFLNKRDLFAEKIQRVPLNTRFQDYTGRNEYSDAVAYLQAVFEARNKNKERTIYSHITCATDTDNIQKVFNAAKDIIIRNSLASAGLVQPDDLGD